MRRALQIAVAIGSLVPVSAGLTGVLLGPDMIGQHIGVIDLDSHYRYLSGTALRHRARLSQHNSANRAEGRSLSAPDPNRFHRRTFALVKPCRIGSAVAAHAIRPRDGTGGHAAALLLAV